MTLDFDYNNKLIIQVCTADQSDFGVSYTHHTLVNIFNSTLESSNTKPMILKLKLNPTKTSFQDKNVIIKVVFNTRIIFVCLITVSSSQHFYRKKIMTVEYYSLLLSSRVLARVTSMYNYKKCAAILKISKVKSSRMYI